MFWLRSTAEGVSGEEYHFAFGKKMFLDVYSVFMKYDPLLVSFLPILKNMVLYLTR